MCAVGSVVVASKVAKDRRSGTQRADGGVTEAITSGANLGYTGPVKICASRMAIAAIGIALGIAGSACTSNEGWVITSFQSDITISKDSTLTVIEDIKVDFGTQLKHGIFRTIPLRYRFDDSRYRLLSLNFQSATDGIRPLHYSPYANSDNQSL